MMTRARLDALVDSSLDRTASSRARISESTLVLQRAQITLADAMHRHARRRRHAWSPTISGGAFNRDDEAPGGGALSGVRVLLVEDNAGVRELFETVFAYCGASVVAAEDGRVAFSLFQAASPHVVVTDIAMPNWTGYRLLHEIRALPPERGGTTPVIAVTADYTEEHDADRAEGVTFDAWLPKPASVAALVTLVEDVTTGWRRSG